ncbi:YeiH family protein [Campylobacter pinnipediorum]|uniref:YeiH family protein n=1 Tax=Campylobacter pinnipediorum TaxID=1965231 RepID=UPI00084D3260|nr:putative sulfate exporter family transporter [Campylobacter pinnipediorum]AQW80853.1 putative membrane protein, YeiH/YadS family [Campylobacter pinnipediorum subsp. pinnipediorum]AQW82472.1 putative membrane protein, YeiH/YadS family [Campylobacter pinnipediorum subsp. pinnipediorum]OPA74513.1 hypothetical protein BFG05_07225 [Campylobacter pinnipediorum subsp. pinnipediorum]
METLNSFLKFKKSWSFIFILGVLCVAISFLPPFSTYFISPLIIAVVLGVILANFFQKISKSISNTSVVKISTKQILRFGIILFGFRISLSDIEYVGLNGITLAFFIVFSTFFLGLFIGKMLGLDYKSSALISSGSSVCGAAAVMASESVVKGGSDKVGIAICTVVLFGSIGMFAYPFLFKIIDFTPEQIGFFIGGSLHEVAHVVAASSSFGELVQKNAVIIKMLRVLMLVPMLFVLGFLNTKEGKGDIKSFIPYFAIFFLIVIVVNSFLGLSKDVLNVIQYFDNFLLSVAMICLGMGINKSIFVNVGYKPFILAILLFLYLMISCYLFTYFIL